MDTINISHDCVIHKELSNNINDNNRMFIIRRGCRWILMGLSLGADGGGRGEFGLRCDCDKTFFQLRVIF